MRFIRVTVIASAAVGVVAAVLTLALWQDPPGDRLTTAFTLDTVSNGVTTTRDGRVFLVLARFEGEAGPRVVERVDGKLKPYPDAAWNAWARGKSPAKALVRVNSLRVGPDADLWLVDVGSPALGEPKLPCGPKLVRVNLSTNTVRRIYSLDAVTSDNSFVEVRFNGRLAFLTDAGAPGLIVLDLKTGAARRVLDGDTSVTAKKPISAEGKVVHGPDGKPVYVHADQLEVSPEGRWLYYQPCSGPLYRVETRWLDDATVTKAELAKHVEKFADTPSTGGTAIDAAGNLYVSDTDRQRVLRIAPDGNTSTLIEDTAPGSCGLTPCGSTWTVSSGCRLVN